MSAQLVSTFVMFAAGIMVGAIIDCIRYMTSLVPKKSIVSKLAYLIELTAWLMLGAITFYFLFVIKGGEWRAIDPLAQIVGIISYDLFFQPIFRFIGRLFVTIIIKPIFFIIRLVIKLIYGIIYIFVRILTISATPIIKIYKTSKKRVLLYKVNKYNK